jgi:hypothetical protein
MIKTKLTVEIDVETQFGPESAVNMIDILTRVPAVKSITVTHIDSEWKSDDYTSPQDSNFRMLQRIPFKLR